MKENIRNTIRQILVYRFNLDDDKAKEEEIVASITKNVEFKGTNLWTLIFAIFIASIGLNVNSTAVIIGAMLISPLMGPIMGLGLGAGIFDFQLIKFSLKNLFIAVLISVMTSALYFWLSPIHSAQSELLARTSPTLWDVLIALFGGLAGIIASSRKNITNAIPGVAIATALMPPLCTAGYGISTGNFYYFAGAFYLFLINSVFIGISTFLIVRFLKFKPAHFVDDATESKVKKYIWTIAILTILPSLYLAYRFVQEEIFRQNVERFISSEIEPNGLYTINQKTDAGKKSLSLLIYGEKGSDSLLAEIASRKTAYGLQDADVRLQSTLTKSKVTPGKKEMPNENEKYVTLLIERDAKIKTLEAKVTETLFQDSTLRQEYQALFGEVEELSVSKAVAFNEAGKKDTLLLIYIKPEKRMKHTDQIKKWLIARYGTEKLRLVTE
jgi:uncharacterized hydrophobic protein (TIGR00271 family)